MILRSEPAERLLSEDTEGVSGMNRTDDNVSVDEIAHRLDAVTLVIVDALS